MGTEDNNGYVGGNTQQGNNGGGKLQHSDTRGINESTRSTGRIEETSVTQNPPKPRGK